MKKFIESNEVNLSHGFNRFSLIDHGQSNMFLF